MTVPTQYDVWIPRLDSKNHHDTINSRQRRYSFTYSILIYSILISNEEFATSTTCEPLISKRWRISRQLQFSKTLVIICDDRMVQFDFVSLLHFGFSSSIKLLRFMKIFTSTFEKAFLRNNCTMTNEYDTWFTLSQEFWPGEQFGRWSVEAPVIVCCIHW